MENKNVGILIIGIAIALGLIVLIFNNSLKSIVSETCSHGPACTMYDTISAQTWMSLGVVAIVFVIGIVIMFTKPKERIIIKTVKGRKKKLNLEGLDQEERKVIDLVLSEGNAMFQSSLMEKLNIGKVKTTRLLDKLEAKQLIERKRRGMNNIIVIK